MSQGPYLNSRELAIKSFYRTVLGREADEPGLRFYVGADSSLELVYMSLYTSDEAENYRAYRRAQRRAATADITLPITLAMFVKDAADSVSMAINSVKSIVREVVVVDTGSVDNTVSICESLGARVYKVGFSDFGSIRTITGHLAREEWVLGLDADEVILEEDFAVLRELVLQEDIDVWGLPRKRWLDLEMTQQVEKDVYPDLQFRLFRNKPEIYYKRRIHEVVAGTDKIEESLKGPHIHHFQDVFKQGDKLKERNKQYKKLYDLDIFEGIEHKGKAVEDIDNI